MPDTENAKQAVKDLRKQIDACIQETKRLNMTNTGGPDPSGVSRALRVATIRLEEGKMWCGKRLEEMDPDDYPADLADRFQDSHK